MLAGWMIPTLAIIAYAAPAGIENYHNHCASLDGSKIGTIGFKPSWESDSKLHLTDIFDLNRTRHIDVKMLQIKVLRSMNDDGPAVNEKDTILSLDLLLTQPVPLGPSRPCVSLFTWLRRSAHIFHFLRSA